MTATKTSDKLVSRDPNGFYVIVPRDAPPPVPLCCPVCDAAMKTREDDVSYREFSCCERCALLWAYSHREEWVAGWRPSQQEIDAANAQRPPLVPVLDTD